MSKIVFGPDHFSPCELDHIKRIQEKHNVNESTVIAEAVRRFIRKVKA